MKTPAKKAPSRRYEPSKASKTPAKKAPSRRYISPKAPRKRRPRVVKWPAPLEAVKRASRTAFHRCQSEEEAVAVADAMLEIGMSVIARITNRSMLLVIQSGPMEQLLTAMARHATETNTPIEDVATELLSKLTSEVPKGTLLN